MKNRNLYLGIFLAILSIVGILIYNLVPDFETTEFNQDAIVQISEGSTTTAIEENTPTTTTLDEVDEIIEIEQSEIDLLLENNTTTDISQLFDTYLLIGIDEEVNQFFISRFVKGQRADVIILALISKNNDDISLVSLPPRFVN